MASVIVTEEQKIEVQNILKNAGLHWFSCTPGFRFLDSDGEECIVIGWGGFRTADVLGDLNLNPKTSYFDGSGLEQRQAFALHTCKFHPATLVGAYHYKGEHHLISIPDMESLSEFKPLVEKKSPKPVKHQERWLD